MLALALVVMTAAPPAGTYVADGARGTLTLGEETFKIESVGGNAHTCSLEGARKGELGTVSDEANPCRVKFAATKGGVQVTPLDEEGCRAWCGARATFDGLYSIPAKGCSAAEVTATRDAFKKVYAQKKWKDAAALLSPLLARCEKFIDRFEQLWIRNDLAIAQHHAGDDAACLKTLEPADDLRTLDDEDAAGGEPAYEEVLKKLARATRTNAKLCGFVAPGAKK